MASAQTEPSMDEILASIRRIISEEDDAPQEVPVRQKLETLQLKSADEAEEPEAQAEEAPKPRARAKKAEPKPEPEAEPEAEELQAEAGADDAEPEAEGGSDHVAEAAAQDELSELDDFEPLPEEPVSASSTMEPAAVAHDEGDAVDDTFDAFDADMASEPEAPAMPQPALAAVAEAVRPAVMEEVSRTAVSEQAAGQAASAFGALEENMRLSSGSGRTIEDMIEAMLAPMLKDWLDANLPRIVEDKVEEEVRRISRRR